MNFINANGIKLLEVTLPTIESYLVIKETLTRMGVTNDMGRADTLYQSCHILTKCQKTKYYIVHFKELHALDGQPTDISEEDIQRRNKIASLLESWGFLTILDKSDFGDLRNIRVTVIPHKEKHNWNLVPKYTIGLGVKNYGTN